MVKRWIRALVFMLCLVWAVPWTIAGLGVMLLSAGLGFLVGLGMIAFGVAPVEIWLGASLARRIEHQTGSHYRGMHLLDKTIEVTERPASEG